MADDARVVDTDTASSLAYTELVAKGQAQGYVTPDDILQKVPNPENDLGLADDLMAALDDAGIKVSGDGSNGTTRGWKTTSGCTSERSERCRS